MSLVFLKVCRDPIRFVNGFLVGVMFHYVCFFDLLYGGIQKQPTTTHKLTSTNTNQLTTEKTNQDTKKSHGPPKQLQTSFTSLTVLLSVLRTTTLS
jgi:hypothetical protein